MTDQRDGNRYHHGDLRRALLRAAEAELAEKGFAGFSLRGCARRAGVSHAAPAHHFGNAEGLLAALAIDAFARLAAAMRTEMDLALPGSRAYVAAAGRGYIQFALANAGLFQMMFRLQGRTLGASGVREAGQAAFGLAAEAVGAWHQLVDPMTDAEASSDVVALWALAHGLSELALASQLGQKPDAAMEAALMRMVEAMPQRRAY